MNYDVIIVGAGFAGAVSARRFAESGKKVLVLEKRSHIGGNAYDWMDENQVMRHEYGPHIFHTNSEEVVKFLSQFTEWYPYEHRVIGYVQGKFVPIPFNLTSIEMVFLKEQAEHLKAALIGAYGMEKKVPILELRKNPDPQIQQLADFIFENVFQYYTMKQWGLTVDQIDPAVTARVPVLVSYDDRYFQNTFQKMPKKGYTEIFRNMLKHPNIEVRLSVDALTLLKPKPDNGTILFDGEEFRLLTSQEVKQIAGRAGRIGIYDIGYVASMNSDIDFIADRLESEDAEIEQAIVGPGEALLKVKRLPLKEKIALWSTREESLSYYRKKDVRDFILILDKIKPYQLEEAVEWRLMALPFDVNNDKLLTLFLKYVEECFIMKAQELSKPYPEGHGLSLYEEYYQKINLYYSFSKAMNLAYDENWVHQSRKRACEEINALL